MRVEEVDKKKQTGIIYYNNSNEIELIAESMDLLIKKQQEMADRKAVDGRGRVFDEPEELRKLKRFRKCKENAILKPKKIKEKQKKVKDDIKDRHKKKMIIQGVKPEDIGDNPDIEDTDEWKQIEQMRRKGEGEELTGKIEVTYNDVYDIINAVNMHIAKLEKDGTDRTTEKEKYDKLKNLLQNAQNQKDKFYRIPVKPRGYGKLRK